MTDTTLSKELVQGLRRKVDSILKIWKIELGVKHDVVLNLDETGEDMIQVEVDRGWDTSGCDYDYGVEYTRISYDDFHKPLDQIRKEYAERIVVEERAAQKKAAQKKAEEVRMSKERDAAEKEEYERLKKKFGKEENP